MGAIFHLFPVPETDRVPVGAAGAWRGRYCLVLLRNVACCLVPSLQLGGMSVVPVPESAGRPSQSCGAASSDCALTRLRVPWSPSH